MFLLGGVHPKDGGVLINSAQVALTFGHEFNIVGAVEKFAGRSRQYLVRRKAKLVGSSTRA